MSNTEDIWELFDRVVILAVSDTSTLKRLSTRNTNEFGSTQANREWILSWKHEIERRWSTMGGIHVSAENAPEEVARLVVIAVSTV